MLHTSMRPFTACYKLCFSEKLYFGCVRLKTCDDFSVNIICAQWIKMFVANRVLEFEFKWFCFLLYYMHLPFFVSWNLTIIAPVLILLASIGLVVLFARCVLNTQRGWKFKPFGLFSFLPLFEIKFLRFSNQQLLNPILCSFCFDKIIF